MIFRILSSALLFVLIPFLGNSSTVSLADALKNEMVSVECSGIDTMAHYGKCLAVSITNNKNEAIDVEIERGMVFQASPLNHQNFVVTRPEIVALAPGQRISTSVNAMCIESSDASPGGDTDFSYHGKSDESMGILLAYLDENNLMNPLGQEAVWTLINKYPLEEIYGSDSIASTKLTSFMESNFDLPKAWDGYEGSAAAPTPTYREMKIGGMVEYYSSRSGDEVYIALFNNDGVLERELYYNPDFPSGKVKVNYEFDAALYTDSSYLIRLTIDGAIKYERNVDLSMLPDRE